MENYNSTAIIILAIVSIVLLIAVLSPNIAAIIHSDHLAWKNKIRKPLPQIIKEKITNEIILVIDKNPTRDDYLSRKDFDEVEVGDYIHRFTTCRPYSKGKYSYNGTRKVVFNDTENKMLTLQELNPKGTSTSFIFYSGKEHHGMTEEGMTLRGSESFECYYNEKYTKTKK